MTSDTHFGQLTIEVTDTGIGIPESEQQVIFEAFRQQAGQSNREYGGTGLGLAISKRLVEKMKGTISVTSEVGKGSTFTVIFPDIELTGNTRRRETFEEQRNVCFEKASILVVDDVASNIEAVQSLLSDSEVSVSAASNGEIALEILKYSTPDLILLDIRMPGMDGYEVARQIKADPEKNQIPIIAFTASIFNSRKIENAGTFEGFLYKPVNRTELYNQLTRFLKYTIKETGHRIEETDLLSRIANSQEFLERLPETVKQLEEKFLPQWEGIKDSLVLFKIEEFADELKGLASEMKFRYLADYADKIKEDIEIVDLESLQELLQDFPEFINKLKQII